MSFRVYERNLWFSHGVRFFGALHLRMTRLFRYSWDEKKENEVIVGLSTECEESYRLVGDSLRQSLSEWHALEMGFFLPHGRQNDIVFEDYTLCHSERGQ